MKYTSKPVCRKRILMVFFVRSERRLQRLRKGFCIKNNRCPRESFLFLLRNHPVITKNASVHSVNSVYSVRKCSFKIFRFCNSLFVIVPFPGDYDRLEKIRDLIVSSGITRNARPAQIPHVLSVNGVTERTFPPNVTKRNCKQMIPSMTMMKLLFFVIPLSGLKWVLRALKPLNVIAIMKVAKTAERK